MKLKKLTATLVALGIAAPAWAADFTIKNIGIGHSAQDLIGDAGFVGNAAHVDAGLVFVEGDA